MASKKIDEELAQLYVDLDRIRDRLRKVSKRLRGDDRNDAVKSANESVGDACGELSYVAPAELVQSLQKK